VSPKGGPPASTTDTGSTIAAALASHMNSPTSPVTAIASGSTITVTAKMDGVATDYSLSTSYDFDTDDFSTPAFTVSVSGATLSGGTD
jgi:phage tail sheath gpL-like